MTTAALIDLIRRTQAAVNCDGLARHLVRTGNSISVTRWPSAHQRRTAMLETIRPTTKNE